MHTTDGMSSNNHAKIIIVRQRNKKRTQKAGMGTPKMNDVRRHFKHVIEIKFAHERTEKNMIIEFLCVIKCIKKLG